MTVRTIVKSVLHRKVDTALEVSIALLFLAAMAFGGWSCAAHAQPVIVSEEAKVEALKRAFQLYYSGATRGRTFIDLTQDRADPMPQHPAAAGRRQ